MLDGDAEEEQLLPERRIPKKKNMARTLSGGSKRGECLELSQRDTDIRGRKPGTFHLDSKKRKGKKKKVEWDHRGKKKGPRTGP